MGFWHIYMGLYGGGPPPDVVTTGHVVGTVGHGPSIEGTIGFSPAVKGTVGMSGFYIDEDMDVWWHGAVAGYDGTTYLNSASVCTAQLKTTAGSALGTAVNLDYQAGTDGNYKGTIDKDNGPEDMVSGTLYELEYVFTHGDYNGKRTIKERAEYHGYTP